MAHTAGVWGYFKNHTGTFTIYTDKGSENIAEVYGSESHDDEMDTARLMAAASEMIESLESVNKYFKDLQNRYALTPHEEIVWKKVSAAIKKATKK